METPTLFFLYKPHRLLNQFFLKIKLFSLLAINEKQGRGRNQFFFEKKSFFNYFPFCNFLDFCKKCLPCPAKRFIPKDKNLEYIRVELVKKTTGLKDEKHLSHVSGSCTLEQFCSKSR